MSATRVPVLLTLFAGTFPNQAEAFLAFARAAELLGRAVRIDEVDVIREAAEVRLAHYFRPAILARLMDARGEDDTLVVLFPSALATERRFPPQACGFRLIGKFAGTMPDAPEDMP